MPRLDYLQRLEAESIHIFREVVAECEKPVMLYSIGKDSSVMLHLALWDFREMLEFRDATAKRHGLELLVYTNEEGVRAGVKPWSHGAAYSDLMLTQALRQALDKYGFDAAFGGGRRDEEKSRAKERIFSFRSAQHRWDPKNQRPELWQLYNTRKNTGESIRVFPLSNWTELDVWQYIHVQNVPIVPLYLAKRRPVVRRGGRLLMVDDDRLPLGPDDRVETLSVRFRTLGCYPLTGADESTADTLPAVIREMLVAKSSERQGRMVDDGAASMERKKQEGYF